MPTPATPDEFKAHLARTDVKRLAEEFVLSDTVHALPSVELYDGFRTRVRALLPAAQYIAVVGSGNWRYSLNPDKLLNEYHVGSDIDVAVVSESLYLQTWDMMRSLHRDHWYRLGGDARTKLLRNGQNIYCGIACPMWLPVRPHPSVYEFKRLLNRLSGADVGYREVKMFYFRNQTEMVDYYQRGFMNAKRELGL